MTDSIYLDHAAATPVDATVLAAMQPYFSEIFYNPSATYTASRHVKQSLEEARARVAYWLGARPSEIIFTAGGTEANNLAIHGVMQQYPNSNIVVSAIEHESVLMPAHEYPCAEVAVAADGRLDLHELEQSINDDTVLVSIMYANNEIGTVQSIREVAKLVDRIRQQRAPNSKPLYLHCDACQAANYLDIHVARLGVDLMTLNGGKLYGPKQSGALYVKAGIELKPLVLGGGQERALRSGTENVPAAIGFAQALDLAQSMRHEEAHRLLALQNDLFMKLETTFPTIVVNGSRKYRLPNNVHITVPGYDNERLLIELDERGIMAASGSACNASNEEPSHVLAACGLSEADIRSSLRFSFGRSTTNAQLNRLVEVLAQLVS